MMKTKSYMSILWPIARKLLGPQCPSFAQRYPYILSWKWLWSFGRPHSTAKICKIFPPLPNKMIKVCNSGYAQKSPYWDLTFLGIIMYAKMLVIMSSICYVKHMFALFTELFLWAFLLEVVLYHRSAGLSWYFMVI